MLHSGLVGELGTMRGAWLKCSGVGATQSVEFLGVTTDQLLRRFLCVLQHIDGTQEACGLLGQGLLHQGALAREMQQPQSVGGRQGGMCLVVRHGAVHRGPCDTTRNHIRVCLLHSHQGVQRVKWTKGTPLPRRTENDLLG